MSDVTTPMPALTPQMLAYMSPATPATLARVAERLRARNIEALVVPTGAEAKQQVLDRIPKGAEVHWGKSKTLTDIGVAAALSEPGEYDALRPRYLKMDRATQMREIRRLIASPDYMLGSVQAITEDGVIVTTSATSSQLGPIANTAGKVILVVGAQKIVPDLDTALRRMREYVLPWEDEQVRKVLPSGSYVGKTLIIERESVKDRLTVILVQAALGI